MIHTETFTVTEDNGPRPAGPPDRCFYCRQKLGEQHKEDCVFRERTVVLRATIEFVAAEPVSFDKEMIEFRYGAGSSWCQSNLFDEGGMRGVDGCLCGHVDVEFVREATVDDEMNMARYGKVPE